MPATWLNQATSEIPYSVTAKPSQRLLLNPISSLPFNDNQIRSNHFKVRNVESQKYGHLLYRRAELRSLIVLLEPRHTSLAMPAQSAEDNSTMVIAGDLLLVCGVTGTFGAGVQSPGVGSQHFLSPWTTE